MKNELRKKCECIDEQEIIETALLWNNENLKSKIYRIYCLSSEFVTLITNKERNYIQRKTVK